MSVVEQVVSTATGIVVFSQSTQLNTYNEAASQGDDLANFVYRHANRGLAAIGTAPPAASPTPASSNGPEANLGKLFGRKKKAAPKATPTPAPKPIVNATAPAAALVNVPTPPRRRRARQPRQRTPRRHRRRSPRQYCVQPAMVVPVLAAARMQHCASLQKPASSNKATANASPTRRQRAQAMRST